MLRSFWLGVFLLGVLCGSVGFGSSVQAEGESSDSWLRGQLSVLVDVGGVAVGWDKKRFIYGDGVYVPASILKLATGYCAIEELGKRYRFKTKVYLKDGWLYLEGGGDPVLVSESWNKLGVRLRQKGIFRQPLEGLVVDGSAFRSVWVDGRGGSLNPHDAGLSALASNFNTVFVEVDAEGVVVSAEEQTPLTVLGKELSRGLRVGKHRINITARDDWSLRYSAELAEEIWGGQGANFLQGWRVGRVPKGASLVHVHYAIKSLEDIVSDMLKYSNNFIANQLVLAVADKRSGRPVSLEKGMEYMRACLSSKGIGADKLQWVEGSGLSRGNRVQLQAMLEVVELFYPWRKLLPQYGQGPWQAAAKTGTLKGVHNLAGFLPGRFRDRPFVIMLNQPRHNREAVFQLLIQHQELP